MRDLYSEQQAKETETLERWGLPGLNMKPVLDNENWKKCEDLVEKYHKYQKFRSEMAEVEVKEALERLNLPGLKIRSVMKQDVAKKCKQLYERAGLKISDPEKKDEYDIQVILADGDLIRVILIEVKSGNAYLWQSTELPPSSNLFQGKSGSWCQLQKGYRFTSELFADIP